MLCELLLEHGQGWKWESLFFELPLEIKDRIRAIPQSQIDRKEDLMLWIHSKGGEFFAKYAYLANISHVSTPPPF